jgi:chemotaxis protein CheY-P-specific phosphatase CheC
MVTEKAQVLEVAAGNVALGFLAMFVKTDEITPEQTEMYRAIVDDVNRKTFGSLLTHLKKTMNLSDSIIKVIDEALARRNYLTHHFFRSHNFALYSEEGRKAMTAELKEIGEKLDLAKRTLDAMAELMDQMAGRKMDAGVIERLIARGKKVDI